MTLPKAKKIFKNPSFLDYREKQAYLYFAYNEKDVNVGDIMVDQYNTMGYVKFISEDKGPFVYFIDGIEGYAKDLKLNFSRVPGTNINQFTQHKVKFGELTKVGRVMVDSLKKSMPYVHMFNNGEIISIRASTNKTIVKQYTKVQLATSYSYFSVVLIPKWNVIIDSFMVKYADRKSRFSYSLLKQLFIDLDKNLSGRSRFKWNVQIGHDDVYNKFVWRAIEKEFQKFQIKDKEH